MKKKDIIEFYNALQQLGGLTGVKFSYAIARNLKALKPEIEALQEAIKPSDEFTKYENERIALAQKHAKKDDKGVAVIESNQYVLEDRKTFEKEFQKLGEKHKSAIASREKQIKEFNALLETESNATIYKIDIGGVPEGISASQMTSIMEMIVEENT